MTDQSEEKKNSSIDIGKILLPKKEVHTPASAERVNAGVLLAQEQAAVTEGLRGGGGLPRDGAATSGDLPAGKSPYPESSNPSVTAAPPQPKKDDAMVKSIQTYKSDVESLVEEKNVSVVSIAAAEAQKREKSPLPQAASDDQEHWIFKRVSLVVGGVLLIAVAAGALAYALTRPTTVPAVPLSTGAPFISVDDTKQVPVNVGSGSTNLMQTLNDARLGVSLSLGLIERLYVTQGSGNNAQEVPIQTLLHALAPEAPQALIRTLTGEYLLAVHSYDENQAILILHTDSYETAYAAMLQWEPTMPHDLLPLFARTPPVHINPFMPIATTTATTSQSVSSTTPGDYFASTSAQLPSSQSGLPTTFADRVVENRDARVIQTSAGDILLLWTFLDRNTIVITTNDATLREVVSRITQAATIPLPQ